MKQFKKVISKVIALTMALMMVFSLGCTKEPEKKITISDETVSIALFGEKEISVELTNITDAVEWTNSDDSVVLMTETADGVKLFAIKAGSATITATAGGKSATCAVTVTGTDSLVLMRTSAKEVEIPQGSEIVIGTSLTYKGSAFNREGVTYTYSVSDAEPAGCVAIEDGVAVAKEPGTAKVSVVASYYGNESNPVTVDVTVKSPLAFGQHENYAFVENGVIATMTEGKTLAYEGIEFNNDNAESIIRFQIVQPDGFTGDYATTEYTAPTGVEDLFITIQDANDPLNYITVFIGTINVACADAGGAYWSHGCVIGTTSSLWNPDYTADSDTKVFAANKFGVSLFGKDDIGWVGYDYGCNGYSFYNAYLETPKNEGGTLDENMISIGAKDSSVYFNINGSNLELLNFANFAEQPAWAGFDTDLVNVYVTTANFGSAGKTDLVIDTIGGKAVVESDLENFKVIDLDGKLVPEFTHTCEFETEYTSDATSHWYACKSNACLEVSNKADHTMEEDACSVCGWHEHVFATEYTVTAASHFKACTFEGCDVKSEEAEHVYEEGACVCSKTDPLRFGQTDRWAHDSVLANLSAGYALKYENVALTNSENDAIVRFQILANDPLGGDDGLYAGGKYVAPQAARAFYITLQDSANADNYVTVLVSNYKAYEGDGYCFYGATIGARANAWGEYTTDSNAVAFIGGNAGLGVDTQYGGKGDGFGSFSLYGDWLGLAADKYEAKMMGIAVKDSGIYMINNGSATLIQDLGATEGKDAWAGFAAEGSVNVYITAANFGTVDNVDIAVDIIGAQAVTSTAGFAMVKVGNGLVA